MCSCERESQREVILEEEKGKKNELRRLRPFDVAQWRVVLDESFFDEHTKLKAGGRVSNEEERRERRRKSALNNRSWTGLSGRGSACTTAACRTAC